MKEITTIYMCDNCAKMLSEDGKGDKHLSLNFGRKSGWVEHTNQ